MKSKPNNKLRLLMYEHRFNQSQLAKESKLSRTAINKLHKNIKIENIQLKTIFVLCDTFNCSIEDLIEYPSKKEPIS